ncbi:hypothetical protein [Serratia marcescens]|uniref:hypothetical protein n=1 Tax=Serratia marcescens TaxID=615 RepID=UPI000744E803|nr:hypothetical protein [Serratia marcescens]CVE58434.1 Uncharacterised protein [Serratia marcescens]
MTLTTTEELKHLAASDNTNELTRRLARECLANREAQPVAVGIERDALRYRFLRDKDSFGDDDEPGLVGWDGLVELGYNEFDAAIDARIAHPNIDYVKLDNALKNHERRRCKDKNCNAPIIGYSVDGFCENCYIAVSQQPAPAVPDDYQHLKNVHELYHSQEKRLLALAQRIKGESFDKYSHSTAQAIDVLEREIFGEDGDACRAAMLAQPVSSGYKLPPHVYRELVNSLRDTAVKFSGSEQLRERLNTALSQFIEPDHHHMRTAATKEND